MGLGGDDLAIHRAVYREAHGRGDPLATARAAAQLRAHIPDLNAADLIAVRAARQRFGQAIREARSRRLTPTAPAVQTRGIALSAPRRFPVPLAASFALIVLLISAVVAEPLRLLVDQTEGGGGGVPAADASDPFVQPVTLSRGRVVLAVAAAEPVAEQAAASAAPEPRAVTPVAENPAQTSGPSAAPGAAGPSGSGVPGPGSGAGVPSSATPTPRATPRPTPLPPLARGFARLSGQVIDASIGRGLAGACVSLGPCSAVSPVTDANGRWTLDLPVGSGRLDWGLEFAKTGYGALSLNVRARTGYIFLGPQRLQPTR